MIDYVKITCPTCHFENPSTSYFCANCGKSLQEKLIAVSLPKQMIAYSVSIFLPPLGLWYGWKYLKQSDIASKRVGIIAIILTIISTLYTLWLINTVVNSVSQSLNLLDNLNF